MPLMVYNTFTGQKEVFEPLHAGKVGMYVCGPTVYDMSHIGHARVYVAFDTIVRYLRRDFDVTYVRNFTDVDDKIIHRASDLGETPTMLSERFIDAFHRDMDALGCARADIEPKVTQHIDEIISLVHALVRKGVAYTVPGKDGAGDDVYFSIQKFTPYGKLGRRNLDDMEAGARVQIDGRKKDPMDFALWKGAAPNATTKWESPWGLGRPGWHIECSAMSKKYLGETFDIHAGGKDLIFPHHENEIAQSEAASGKTMCRFWMHNGFVNIDDEKMSKSLGNFFTVRTVLQQFDPLTIRYYLLSTHYRSPINFSDAGLKEAEARVKYIYETLQRLHNAVPPKEPSCGPYRNEAVEHMLERFEQAMNDDFNTAKAIGDLSDAFKLINEILDKPGDAAIDTRTLWKINRALHEVGEVLGLFTHDADEVLRRMADRKQTHAGIDASHVESLLTDRIAARNAKDFTRADAIRDELTSMGIVIKDSPKGSTWEVA